MDYIKIVLQNKKIFAIAMASAIAISGIIISLTTPRYLATAVLFIEMPDRAKITKAALESKTIIRNIISPEILKTLNINDGDDAIEKIVKNRQVVLDANFHTIEVRITWDNPENAAILANMLVRAIDDIVYPLDSLAFWKNKAVRYEREIDYIAETLRQSGNKIQNKELQSGISKFFETEEKILENKSYIHVIQEATPPTRPISINKIAIILTVATLAIISNIVFVVLWGKLSFSARDERNNS